MAVEGGTIIAALATIQASGVLSADAVPLGEGQPWNRL